MAITYLDEPDAPAGKITYLEPPSEQPKLTDDEERDFQTKYKAVAGRLGLNPDPDDPKHFYDYRAAYKAGKLEPGPDGHFASEFKREGHPRMVLDGVNTKTGEKVGKITYLEPPKSMQAVDNAPDRALPPDQTAENQSPENKPVSSGDPVADMQAAGMIPKPAKKPAWLPRGDASDLVGFVPFHGVSEAAVEGYKSAQGLGKEVSPLASKFILGGVAGPLIQKPLEKAVDVGAGLLIGATGAAGTAFNPATAGASKLEDVYDVARDFIEKKAAGTPITPQMLKEYETKVRTGFSEMFPEAKPEVTESTARNFLTDLTSQALNEKFNTALLVLGGVEGGGGGRALKAPRMPDLFERAKAPKTAEASKTPELMTPEEWIRHLQKVDDAERTSEGLPKREIKGDQDHPSSTSEAIDNGRPVLADNLDNFYPDLKDYALRQGYVREGDRYVLKPSAADVERTPAIRLGEEQVTDIQGASAPAERVSETAFRIGDEVIPSGSIHNAAKIPKEMYGKGELESGFLTDKGRFVTREEAASLQGEETKTLTHDQIKKAESEEIMGIAEPRTIEPLQESSMGQPKPLPEGTGSAPVVSRRAIIEDISKTLDIPIRFGRVFSKKGGVLQKAGGYFDPQGQLIQSKFANDLIVVAHEGGHKLDDIFKIRGRKHLQTELDYLGDRNRPDSRSSWTPSRGFKYKLGEGVAEFVRYWLTEPEQARKLAPSTYKEFEAILDSDPKLRASFDKAKDDIRVWRESSAQGRIRGSVSVGEPALKSNRPGERLINQFLDEYHTLSNVVDIANKNRGKPIDPVNDPYLLARLFKGMDATVQSFLGYRPSWIERKFPSIARRGGTVDFRTRKVNGESLQAIIDPIAKSGKIGDFRDYMIVRRARELHRRGKETGLSNADVEATFKKLDSPEFQDAFDRLQQWNDRLLQYAEDAKLISPETRDIIQAMNRDYVPYNRVFEVGAGEAPVEGGGTGRGLNMGGSPIKGIKGSIRDIVDPLESMIKNTFHMISAADKSWVNLALAQLANEPGMGRFVRRAAPKMVPHKVALSQLKDQLEALGADFAQFEQAKQRLADAGKNVKNIEQELLLNFFEPSKAPSYGENIIKVNRAGKPEFYQLDPELYRAIKSLDREEMNMLGRFMTGFANVKRSGVTLVPEFVISNAVRDTVASAIISKYNHVPFVQTVRGLFSLLGRPELVNEWAVSGGKLGIENMYFDRTATQKALQKMLGKRLDGTPYSAADWGALILKSPLELLRKMSAISELATRVGEYEIAKKAMIKKGMLPENYKRLAAFESRNLLDFARSGAKMKAWNGMMPFFNAQVQGIVRMGEAFKKNPIGTTVKAFTWLTVPTAILYSINRNDPEYWDRPQWERDLFWLFPFGKDDAGKTRFLRIPKPFEWGAVFATLPERIFGWIDNRDPKAFDELGQRIAGSFTPLPTGNPLFSILEVMAGEQGYSFWRGKKIVPESQKQLPPELQFDDRTSLSAKKLGRALRVSPKKIDYLVYGMGGGLANQTVHYGLDSILSLATGDETAALKPIPGRRFVTSPAGFESQAVEQFYDKLDKLKRERARIRLGEPAELPPEEMAQLPAMERLSKGLSGLRKQAQGETDTAKKQQVQLQIRQLVLPFIEQPEKEGLKRVVEETGDSE